MTSSSPGAGARRRGTARFPPTTDLNPYQLLLYRHLAPLGYSLAPAGRTTAGWLWRSRRRVRFLHFHWQFERCFERRSGRRGGRGAGLPSWFRAAHFALWLIGSRALGYRLVWTLHELYRDGRVSRRLERTVGQMMGRMAHVVFVHDDDIAERARAELGVPDPKIEVVPHPSFVGLYGPSVGGRSMRRTLNIAEGALVYLCFGVMRRDKQIALLIDAFSQLDRDDAVLIVAGEVRDPRPALVCQAAARTDPRLRLWLTRVPDDRVADVFGAADVFVKPCGDGWTSGSMILALSLGLPVVAADRPSCRRLIGGDQAGWTFRPGDQTSLRDALAAAGADRSVTRSRAQAALRRGRAMPTWPDLADRTAAVLDALSGEVSGGTDLTRPRGRARPPAIPPRRAAATAARAAPRSSGHRARAIAAATAGRSWR